MKRADGTETAIGKRLIVNVAPNQLCPLCYRHPGGSGAYHVEGNAPAWFCVRCVKDYIVVNPEGVIIEDHRVRQPSRPMSISNAAPGHTLYFDAARLSRPITITNAPDRFTFDATHSAQPPGPYLAMVDASMLVLP